MLFSYRAHRSNVSEEVLHLCLVFAMSQRNHFVSAGYLNSIMISEDSPVHIPPCSVFYPLHILFIFSVKVIRDWSFAHRYAHPALLS